MYQTPYGVTDVARHVYRSAAEGATYVPMEVAARLIGRTTTTHGRQSFEAQIQV